MDPVQKEHIRSHVHDLVSSTDCNDFVLAKLRSEFILSRADIEDLKNTYANSGRFEAATKLYAMVTTKRGSYHVLIDALKEAGQTEPCKILQTLEAK